MATTTRPGAPADAIRGVAPRLVHTPASVDDCAELLPRAGRVAFAGGGTELDLGRPPTALDAVVRTERLARVLEYAPADMVLTAEAGVTLRELHAVAGEHRQRLALDPPRPDRATVGGIVATNAFGPLRARFGPVRDLLIGVTLVRADGAIARGGGKVVKNVAGFDLPRLACGSLGTLAMIAAATFRLHPLPEVSATAQRSGLTAQEVVAFVAEIRRAQLEPAGVVAIRGEAGRFDVGLLFEGFERGVHDQLTRLGVAPLDHAAAFWSRHDEARAAGPLRVKLGSLPSRLPAVAPLVAPFGSFVWYPTLGLGFAGGPAPGAATLAAARDALVAEGGSLVVETAPDDAFDPWGPVPQAFGLMQELKRRLDPEGRLNPGRFVGGL